MGFRSSNHDGRQQLRRALWRQRQANVLLVSLLETRPFDNLGMVVLVCLGRRA
jgi:hypothetical protein